jgi:hypothetical protein
MCIWDQIYNLLLYNINPLNLATTSLKLYPEYTYKIHFHFLRRNSVLNLNLSEVVVTLHSI